MAKRFTLVEAQSLIPEVDRLLRRTLDAKAEYQDAERVIREFSEHVMMMGGVIVDRDRALEARARRDDAAARHSATPAQIALAWLIAQPGVTAPIASATSPKQLHEIMQAPRLKLPREDLQALDKASA